MRPIIRVENLSKKYKIGARQASYQTIRETLGNALRTPLSWLRRNGHSAEEETIWALKDVNFEVMPGEVVGIIGRNGAGKSTLLKILSRITEPTTGQVDIYGRVGSLLEVGTGFHQELTGRDNIYLNGAILGMRRAEIDRKFDEIVDFAEIEKFIDTPVKHYSSGMYMRLAFAVAAHLEPDILIVDEVLAVGDKSFQLKCLNKMQDVSARGRAILFVSHDVNAVNRLCQRAIYLESGRITGDGQARKIVSSYLVAGSSSSAIKKWPDANNAPGNGIVSLVSVRVRNEKGDTVETSEIDCSIGIEMKYFVHSDGHVLIPNSHFYNEEGICVFILHDLDPQWRNTPRRIGSYTSTAWIPGNFLAEGTLFVGVAITTYQPFNVHFYERNAVSFTVVDSIDSQTARGDYAGNMPGIVRPLFTWTTETEYLNQS